MLRLQSHFTYIRYSKTKGWPSISRLSTFPVHYSSCFPMYLWHWYLASHEISLILASQNRLLPILFSLLIFSLPPARNDREVVLPEFFFSRISIFERGKFFSFSVSKYWIIVKLRPLQPFTVHHIAANLLKVPRLANQYLCEINMSSRTSVSFRHLDPNTCFFFAPPTGTYHFDPNHRAWNGPLQVQNAISRHFTNRSIKFCVSPGYC